MIDCISGGRLIAGFPVGTPMDTCFAYGQNPSHLREKYYEAHDLITKAWTEPETFAFNGRFNQQRYVNIWPRPIQKPHPPIWVAAFGPKALAQAGRLGLPYLCSPMESMATLEANYGAHRTAAREAGVDEPDVVPLMRTVFISKDEGELKKLRLALHENTDNTRLAEGETQEDWTIIGTPNEVVDQIGLYQERLGMTHMVATRIRVPGIPQGVLRDSVALLAETLGAS